MFGRTKSTGGFNRPDVSPCTETPIIFRDEVEPKQSFETYCQDFPVTQAAILSIFDEIMHSSDVFAANPDVTKIYDMFALATLPDYRGRGLGRNSIDIFVGPESGPEPGPSHVMSFETCLNL